MRITTASLVFIASLNFSNPAHSQDSQFIIIPDGEQSFQIPQSFAGIETPFFANEVSNALASNSVNAMLNIDGVLEGLEGYYFNLDDTPETLEAKELVFRAYTQEYYARLFPVGTKQHGMAEKILNGDLETGEFNLLLNAILDSSALQSFHPPKYYLESYFHSDALHGAELSSAQSAALSVIIDRHLDELIYHSTRIELVLGLFADEGLPFAQEFVEEWNQLDDLIWQELEGANVEFEIPAPTIKL